MASQKLSMHSTYRLLSGYDIPVLGYGVFRTPPAATTEAVLHAIKAGYRSVDSASFYDNEAGCAAALLASGVPREQLFFTTKYFSPHMSYDEAKQSVARSLATVEGLGYIDLVLLHSPNGGNDARRQAWRALVEAVEAGQVRSIGVSNFGVHHLDDLEAHIKEVDARDGPGKGGVLSVNQIELHPWLAHRDIVAWCQRRGVLCQAWGPLKVDKAQDPALVAIAHRLGRSPAQVLLRWSLQKGFNPLPKSVTPSRIEQNAQVFDFELSAQDMQDLETDEYSSRPGWDLTVVD